MKKQAKSRWFLEDDRAVLGLPMRLTVSLIIGTIALVAILSFILQPCLFPGRMDISVTPYVTILSGSGPENVSYTVFVQETDGRPLNDVSVIITGLGGAGAGFSDESGTALIQLQVQLQEGIHEGYLDISVKAPCHQTIEANDAIKVVASML